ncbi:hypothetical protein Anapl_14281 [Anas platyrhynchos]|uniref:Uncharacterized protein n=1 Tax=Anas platyrhynchos TaxID=8839 RepID=R0KC48_ANAPL|nr:hypothetical protein Anapl_14281 [Anas platyrhynchos]
MVSDVQKSVRVYRPVYVMCRTSVTLTNIGVERTLDPTGDMQHLVRSVPSTRGFGTEKRSKKPIFQGLKLPVSINGDTEFISPFVSRTFELIAFLSSNFKVSVAVAFLQRRDNLICFDGNAISYSVSANLFDKTGDLRVGKITTKKEELVCPEVIHYTRTDEKDVQDEQVSLFLSVEGA